MSIFNVILRHTPLWRAQLVTMAANRYHQYQSVQTVPIGAHWCYLGPISANQCQSVPIGSYRFLSVLFGAIGVIIGVFCNNIDKIALDCAQLQKGVLKQGGYI